jgi:hypothetical protein
MRLIKGLFMFLIGMISFTVMATTATLEQKQKTELVKELCSISMPVSVVINDNAALFPSNDKLPLELKRQCLTQLAIITDVGWNFQNKPALKIHYKEKLLESCNLDFTDKTNPFCLTNRNNL